MTPLPPNDERVILRAPTDDVERWKTEATRLRMTLSDWIRRTLNANLPPASAFQAATDEFARKLLEPTTKSANAKKGRR